MRRSERLREKDPLVDAAVKRYRRNHWGLSGPRGVREYGAADPRIPSSEIGELVAVVYRTRKGEDRRPTDYEHEFRDPRPLLAYNDSGLIIAGGIYHVTTRGIID